MIARQIFLAFIIFFIGPKITCTEGKRLTDPESFDLVVAELVPDYEETDFRADPTTEENKWLSFNCDKDSNGNLSKCKISVNVSFQVRNKSTVNRNYRSFLRQKPEDSKGRLNWILDHGKKCLYLSAAPFFNVNEKKSSGARPDKDKLQGAVEKFQRCLYASLKPLYETPKGKRNRKLLPQVVKDKLGFVLENGKKCLYQAAKPLFNSRTSPDIEKMNGVVENFKKCLYIALKPLYVGNNSASAIKKAQKNQKQTRKSKKRKTSGKGQLNGII